MLNPPPIPPYRLCPDIRWRVEEENAKDASRRRETPTAEEAAMGAVEAITATIEVFTTYLYCI